MRGGWGVWHGEAPPRLPMSVLHICLASQGMQSPAATWGSCEGNPGTAGVNQGMVAHHATGKGSGREGPPGMQGHNSKGREQ